MEYNYIKRAERKFLNLQKDLKDNHNLSNIIEDKSYYVDNDYERFMIESFFKDVMKCDIEYSEKDNLVTVRSGEDSLSYKHMTLTIIETLLNKYKNGSIIIKPKDFKLTELPLFLVSIIQSVFYTLFNGDMYDLNTKLKVIYNNEGSSKEYEIKDTDHITLYDPVIREGQPNNKSDDKMRVHGISINTYRSIQELLYDKGSFVTDNFKLTKKETSYLFTILDEYRTVVDECINTDRNNAIIIEMYIGKYNALNKKLSRLDKKRNIFYDLFGYGGGNLIRYVNSFEIEGDEYGYKYISTQSDSNVHFLLRNIVMRKLKEIIVSKSYKLDIILEDSEFTGHPVLKFDMVDNYDIGDIDNYANPKDISVKKSVGKI